MPESQNFLEQWQNGYAEMNRNLFQNTEHNLLVPSSYREYQEFIKNAKSNSTQQEKDHSAARRTLEEIDQIMNQ